MRNLCVFREECIKLKPSDGEVPVVIVAAAQDFDNSRLFFASVSCSVFGLHLSSPQLKWALSLVDTMDNDGVPVLQEGDTVVAMEFMMEKEVLVIGVDGGNILQVHPFSEDVEVVGSVEGGIVNMAVSPDGELLVLVTGLGQLLFMTQDWDLLYEISLNQPPGSTYSGRIPPGGVQISWRGDGKFLATLLCDSLRVWERESGTLHSCGDGLLRAEKALAWCPGGARIATACIPHDSKKPPIVLFFERNGLKRDSFEISGPSESCVEGLGWNCDSDLLAVLLRCGDWDSVQVWTCRNYQWYLKQEWRFLGSEKVKFIWDAEKPLQIVFFTSSGTWQRITMCWKSAVMDESAFVIQGCDVLVTPLALALIPPPMFLFKIAFPSPVQTVGFLCDNADSCLLAAILSDGSLSVVPLPGMRKWEDLEGTCLVGSRVQQQEAGLNLGTLRHLTWLDSTTLLGSAISFVKPKSTDNLRSISGSGNLGSDVADMADRHYSESLVELLLECVTNNSLGVGVLTWKILREKLMSLNQPVVAIASTANLSKIQKSAFLQLGDGSVLSYVSNVGTHTPFHLDNSGASFLKETTFFSTNSAFKFSNPSPWFNVTSFNDSVKRDSVLVGLDDRGRLQVDSYLVADDCTSFTLHESKTGDKESKIVHLVYTTMQDMLHVINLDDILVPRDSCSTMNNLDITGHLRQICTGGKSKADSTEVSLKVRPLWERGAKLIATLGGKDVSVILQAARGNLETVYPRGLVLGAIAAALSMGNFQDAMLLARQHRINFNFLVDYIGWKDFTQVAGEFVKQIHNLSHVTDLVCALNKENIMLSTYKNLIPIFKGSGLRNNDVNDELLELRMPKLSDNKVQGVLCALRAALEKQVPDSPARELCILTTLARSDPPLIEEALLRLKRLREAEIRGESAKVNEGAANKSNENKEKLSAEAGLKHLIWLTDASKLFDAALGLYDMHLAAMVASHSQRDPKEFLPILEHFGNMPGPRMLFSIDCRLGRYESALRNCVEMSDHFEDCLLLIQKNPSLFSLGLRLFNGEKRVAIMEAWGDHFVNQQQFEDAAVAFCACSQFRKAMDAYKSGGLWQGVMIMAGRLSLSTSEVKVIAGELIDELQAMGRPGDAAILALEYCKDIDAAIPLLIDSHNWMEVVRWAYLYDRSELVKSKLEPAVIESASFHIKDHKEGLEKVSKYLARYLGIRHRRLLLTAKLKMEEQDKDAIDDDALSIASSNLSGLSAYTHGSQATTALSQAKSYTRSEGRPKGKLPIQTRKAQGGRIRAGSPGEELALVEHLKSMSLSPHFLEEHRTLLQVLLHLGHEDIAQHLQAATSQFIGAQKDAVRQIEMALAEEQTGAVLDRSGNAELPRIGSHIPVQNKDSFWMCQILTP